MEHREAKRSDRVAERVRAELSEMFMRGEVRDPRARGVVVSAVRVTDDLSIARVYVRLLEDTPGRAAARAGARREALLSALESARGHLRRHLGGRLGLRRTPELNFFWDDVVDSGGRMEQLLAEIAESDEDATPASDEDVAEDAT